MDKPINTSFRNRGENMTRIETFVAAAFAFAVTMMMISLGEISTDMKIFIEDMKQVPAFAASCAIIIWIWHTHATWCRRFGLEDGKTIFLSSALIIIVLVYVYPLRIMMQGLFQVLSDGYFPLEFSYQTNWELRFVFINYAIGFLLLCLNFVGLYWHAYSKRELLKLNQYESFDTRTELLVWSIAAGVCVGSSLIALFGPLSYIAFSGHIFFSLFPLLIGCGQIRKHARQKLVIQNTVP
ncbi:TMEM175 family protein [Glaciecola petra]|uniref:TMEM175 family protein n=1 Tax=Glaciecola petra TaxID=3075602 RepID=A0ABU2ZTK9_9ALTE|nr:TMEM175 family protein [Aestuariibacter sp. P117]MDT0595745.1 TMEM175 family protein [Aestuariibacter sp. P117]